MDSYIIYAEINIICILILGLISSKIIKSVFIQERKILFLKVSISIIIFLAMDFVWVIINNNPSMDGKTAIWIFDACYYVTAAFMGLYWFEYSENVQQSKFATNRNYKILSRVPFVILLFMIFASYKTGWLFYIDSANTFHRGPAYLFDLGLSYGYIFFTALKAFILSRRTEDYQRKIVFRTLAQYVIPTIIAGVLQVFLSNYPIICVGNAFGILYVYLTIQEQMISKDPLTKLNNRNQLYQTLSTKLAQQRNDMSLYLLIMDIDYFKSINDRFGHIEGDKALEKVANILLNACDNYYESVYRFGGDEFVILCETEDETEVKNLCKRISEALQFTNTSYQLTLSIGFTKYSPEIKSQQELIDRADQELYKVKKSRKIVDKKEKNSRYI